MLQHSLLQEQNHVKSLLQIVKNLTPIQSSYIPSESSVESSSPPNHIPIRRTSRSDFRRLSSELERRAFEKKQTKVKFSANVAENLHSKLDAVLNKRIVRSNVNGKTE